MKKILMLGCSAAGIKSLETIRKQDQESEIAIFTSDGELPVSRFIFPDFLSGAVKENQTALRPKEFYKQHNLHLILDKKLSRVNLKRKKLFAEDKDQFDFDVLIVSDTPTSKLPDLRGTNKEGVWPLRKWADMKKISGLLPITETIAVEARSPLGLQTALALRKRGREVLLIVPTPFLYQEIFDLKLSPRIYKLLTDFGIRLILDNPIAEILGDLECKAIRLKSGKVLSAQMVIFADAGPDLRLFAEQGWPGSSAINGDAAGQTAWEDVFALDDLAYQPGIENQSKTEAEWEDMGIAVGQKVLGCENNPRSSPRHWSFTIGDNTVTTLGDTQLRPNRQEVWEDNERSCRKLFLQENVLTGAVLFNCEEDKSRYLEAISHRSPWPGAKNSQSPVEPNAVSLDPVSSVAPILE